MAVRGSGAEARLVAYWVRKEGPEGPEGQERTSEAWGAALEAGLRAKLPGYMVPGVYEELERLPRTANGKLDRRGLPEPRRGARAEEERGGWTATERVVAELWRELLGQEVGRREESFFALGGHSLLAVRLVARLRECFGVALPLASLFDRPTVAGVARALAPDAAEAARVEEIAAMLLQVAALSEEEALRQLGEGDAPV